MLFAKAELLRPGFTDSGRTAQGRRGIAGLGVGTVEGLKIDSDHIVVILIGTNTIGCREPPSHPHRHHPG